MPLIRNVSQLLSTTIFRMMMWCMYAYPHTPVSQCSAVHHIYFVCRASTTKSTLIAKEFNLRDSLISHVALGIKEEGKMKIFHVEDKKGNAFTVSSFQEFIQPGVFYYCVYAIPVSCDDFHFINLRLKSLTVIKFDSQLLLNNEAMYCSEFCLSVLTSSNPGRFAFAPQTRPLSNPFIRSYLNRKSITYIPVDFFLQYSQVTKISESRIRYHHPVLQLGE